MPHSEQHLRLIYDDLVHLHEHDQLRMEKIGKNETIQVFGHTVVQDARPEDLPRLKLAEANEFQSVVQTLGLNLDDDINKVSTTGKQSSILHQVIKMGHLEWITRLLDHGANPLVEDADGNNCLMLAALEGQQDILQQFSGMVTKEQPKHHAHDPVKNAPEAKAQAVAVAVAKQDPVKAPEQKHLKPQKKNHNRVMLTDADLKIVNKKTGKTVLMILAEKQQEDASPNSPAKPAKAPNVLEHFKDLVLNMKVDGPKNKEVKTEEKAETKKKETVVDTTAIEEAVNAYQASVEQYSAVMVQFMGFFEETRNTIRLKNADNKKQYSVLNAFVDADKERVGDVVLPTDRERIAGVLALLQNYSYFSFGTWKHFRGDANTLIAPYVASGGVDKKTIAKVSEVVELYQRLLQELARVESLDHGKNEKNDRYNSEYCRRLTVCKKRLEETVVIQHYDVEKMAFNTKKYALFLECTHHKLKMKKPQ